MVHHWYKTFRTRIIKEEYKKFHNFNVTCRGLIVFSAGTRFYFGDILNIISKTYQCGDVMVH